MAGAPRIRVISGVGTGVGKPTITRALARRAKTCENGDII